MEEKEQRNAKKVYVHLKKHSLLWTCPTDLCCNMMQTFEIIKIIEIISDKKTLAISDVLPIW